MQLRVVVVIVLLALAHAARADDSPAIPAAAPPVAAPTADLIAPTERAPAPVGATPPAVVQPTTSPPPVVVVVPASAHPAPGFTDVGQSGWYLQTYAVDYVAVGLTGLFFASGLDHQLPSLPALIGPQFNLDKPDLAVLTDPRLHDIIGEPLLQEKVPEFALGVGAAALILGYTGLDLGLHQDVHRTHAVLLGGAEAVLGALTTTEILKLTFGRLRPDFAERYTRAACGGTVSKPAGLDCSAVNDGFVVSKADLLDGMKSFSSGHAAVSFAVATYLSLQIGSNWVWHKDTPEWTAPVGVLAMGALGTVASFVAASRLSDHRHHPEDVAVGTAIGVTSGAAAYFLHFDLQGNARWRGVDVKVAPLALADGAGLSVSGTL